MCSCAGVAFEVGLAVRGASSRACRSCQGSPESQTGESVSNMKFFCGEAFGSRLPVLEGIRRLHFLIRSCQHSWANKTYTAVTVEIGQTETPRRSSEYCKVPKCDSGQLQPSRSKHQPEQARLMQTGPVDPRVVSNGLVERIHHHNLEPLVDSVL